MLRALAPLLVFLACFLAGTVALADELETAAEGADDRAAAEALYLLGERDDAAMDFARALARYEASVARLPSNRYAPRASRRSHELRTHAEGGFAPLVRLETVRRDRALADDPAAIDALVKDAATFPAGKVRVDARMLAAEAYLGRLRRPDDALPLLGQVADDPDADVVTARDAASQLLASYTDRRDYDGALPVAERYAKLLPPRTRKDLARLLRRRPIRLVAYGDLAVLAALALLSLAGARKGRAWDATLRVTPMAAAFAVVACGVAGYLASRYEQSSPLPFGSILPAMLVVILLARASSAGGSASVPARATRAVVAFGGVFAAAFLLLDRMDPVYLSGFGL